MGKASKNKQERKEKAMTQAEQLAKFRQELADKISAAFVMFTDGELLSLIGALNVVAPHAETTPDGLITANAEDIKRHGAVTFYHQVQRAAELYLEMADLERQNQQAASPTIALPNGKVVSVPPRRDN